MNFGKAFVGALGLVLAAAVLADPPDSELNPATGDTESVDLDGNSSNRVRHTLDKGQGGRSATLVSSAPGANPRIAITSNGNSWVTWWKDGSTDEVYVSVRDVSTGSWTGETLISGAGVDSRYPEIIPNGSAVWLVYEVDEGSSRSIEVQAITDDPEPIGSPVELGSTGYTGDIDVSIHSESGKVWVTWVDSSSEIGWSEHVSGAWTTTDYESYSGSTRSAAREEIKTIVLAP